MSCHRHHPLSVAAGRKNEFLQQITCLTLRSHTFQMTLHTALMITS